MRKLVMGCAVATLVALSARSVARPPASAATLPPGPLLRQTGPEIGIASWYGEECQGNLTASGEVYDMEGLTAANWDYPFGTKLRVTNLVNNKSVIVRVNDRGPGIPGRAIDLSMAAAKRLGFIRAGVTPVEVEVLHLAKQGAKDSTLAQTPGLLPDGE